MLAAVSKISMTALADCLQSTEEVLIMSERTCLFCSKTGLGLLQCSACGNVYYCDRGCQKSDWRSHKKDCRPFRECEIAGKNKGLVATRTIKRGQVLLRDKALLVLKKSQIKKKVRLNPTPNQFSEARDFQRTVLLNQFKALSAKDQSTVLSLHHENETESVEERLQDVFECNGIECVPVDSICLYSTIPR